MSEYIGFFEASLFGSPPKGEQMLHQENALWRRKTKKQGMSIGFPVKANASAFQQNLHRTMMVASSSRERTA
ncbi:MAG TPA: hypothetical protein PLQ15_02375 [Syntrophales bacterium]|nr:hypothetical protein [Syntrophobacterales bacterium]HQL89420.1 hypothetical protein [Syntrophales bacterium]